MKKGDYVGLEIVNKILSDLATWPYFLLYTCAFNLQNKNRIPHSNITDQNVNLFQNSPYNDTQWLALLCDAI